LRYDTTGHIPTGQKNIQIAIGTLALVLMRRAPVLAPAKRALDGHISASLSAAGTATIFRRQRGLGNVLEGLRSKWWCGRATESLQNLAQYGTLISQTSRSQNPPFANTAGDKTPTTLPAFSFGAGPADFD